MGYRRLVDGYLDGERGENLMVWYLTRHTPWKNARYELHRPDLFLRMAKLVEFTDRDGRLPYSHLAACLCMAFSVDLGMCVLAAKSLTVLYHRSPALWLLYLCHMFEAWLHLFIH
ncbi:hypothetical protein [Parabacteroides sp.]